MSKIAKIDEAGIIELPKSFLKKMYVRRDQPVYISIEDRKIVLRGSRNGNQNAIASIVDEFNKIILPCKICQFLHAKHGGTVYLELYGESIVLANKKPEYCSEKKDLLDLKNERELADMCRRNYDDIFSIMQNFYYIILFGKYSEANMQIMIDFPCLLEELAYSWCDDSRVIELQETVLQEFLNSRIQKTLALFPS